MSIFSYVKSKNSSENQQNKNVEDRDDNKNSIFSYVKEKNVQKEIPEEISQEKPKSFTQRVAQELTESEQLEKGVERNIARGTSRILERGLGTPGDIQEFIGSLTGLSPPIKLPTSHKLKETSEKLSQGYTKAETPFEEKTDEYLQDVASYMLPGAKGYNYARNLGIPLVGSLAKEGVSKLGASEGKQTAAKLGTMLSLDLLSQNPGGVTKYIGDFFKRAKNSIPKAASANANSLLGNLNNLHHEISLGGSAAHKNPALTKIEELKNKIVKDRNGKYIINAEELPEFRKTINKILDDLNAFSLTTSKEVRSSAIPLLNKVKSAVIDAGNEYGKKNPQFLENWQKGNEAASVYYKSQIVKNFIQKTLGKQLTGTLAKALFGFGGGVASKMLGVATPATLAAAGAAVPIQAGKLLYRVIKSPTLARYYANVIKGASKGNSSQVISNFRSLDEKLKKEDEKEEALIKKYTES